MLEDRNRRVFFVVGLICLVLGQSYLSDAISTGAPLEACTDLTPGHSVEAQTGASPYLISVPSYYIPEQPFTGELTQVALSCIQLNPLKG